MLSILLIHEESLSSNRLRMLLEECGYMVVSQRSLSDAFIALKNASFQLVVSKGTEALTALRKLSPNTPIVIFSEEWDQEMAAQVMALGAQDYITNNELEAVLLKHVVEFAVERQKQQEAFHALIFQDELTGIYNRRGFLTLAEQHIELAKRFERGFFLFLIDVDHLKEINDHFGHHQGDLALITVGNCLKKAFRSSDVIARIGGDEFAILVLSSNKQDITLLEENIWNQINGYNFQHPSLALSLSIGSAHFDPEQECSLEDLLQLADSNLYVQKRIRTI